MNRILRTAFLAALVTGTASAAHAQQRQPVQPADYARWAMRSTMRSTMQPTMQPAMRSTMRSAMRSTMRSAMRSTMQRALL